MQHLTIAISIFALIMSGASLWLSMFWRGNLRMTQPNVVFFGPDGGVGGISKVYLRALIYTTGRRGIVLEHLFARIRRGETQQNFNIWVYGEKELARGSGLFVGQEGIATNHHFLLPSDVHRFDFAAGEYNLDIFAKVVGRTGIFLLSSTQLTIDKNEAEKLKEPDNGIYFDWGPDARRYQAKVDCRKSKSIDHQKFLEALQNGMSPPSSGT